MAGSNQQKIKWSPTLIVACLILYVLGFVCIGVGIEPFVSGVYRAKDFANIGFMLLIIFFMLAFFKIHKNSRLIFWICSFSIIIYTDLMFSFYETLLL